MNINTTRRKIIKGLNVGTEIECLTLYRNSLLPIDKKLSLSVFKKLIKKYHYRETAMPGCNDTCAVSKTIFRCDVKIQLETTYSMFEIAVDPVKDLKTLEKLHKKVLQEFNECIESFDCIVWPFGVAPYATNLMHFAQKITPQLRDDVFTKQSKRIEDLTRLAYICAHQVSLDVPVHKVIPTINTLYKNLGKYIDLFTNSKVYANNTLYNEGRYYWWSDSDESLKNKDFMTARAHDFPPHELTSFQNLIEWLFKGFGYIVRGDKKFLFKNIRQPIDAFIRQKKPVVIDENNNRHDITLEKDDLLLFLRLNWIDFKPHFDFDDNFTVAEFISDYVQGNLDVFFKKHALHAWIEIRPCSPHFEDNAMVIPRYFYTIFKNLNTFITESKKISWAMAKKQRDRAIGYYR